MATLIFDFDGTLADSFELVLDVAHELTGARRRTPEEVEELRQLPLLTAVRRMGVRWWMIPRMWIVFRRHMYGRMHEVHLFPGIPKLMSELSEAGHQLLVLSSNREDNVRACLRAHGVEQCFQGIYHGNVMLKAGALRRIMRRSGASFDNAYYIGNEVLDVVAAHRAGMKAVAVTWSGQDNKRLKLAQPDAMVSRTQSLRELFLGKP
jgi:phosphoglycolate phosphatase-like HAD superfamily hydrolase